MSSKRQKSSTVRVILSDEAKEQEQLALQKCEDARKKWINSTHIEELEEVISMYRDALNAKKTVETKDRKSHSSKKRKSAKKHLVALSPKDYKKTGERLSLLYLQLNQPSKAQRGLELLGFKCRLADSVLNYPMPKSITSMSKRKKQNKKSIQAPCAVLDNFLTNGELMHLQEVFVDRDSDYWKLHNYQIEPPSPYFSFVIKISPNKPTQAKFGFLGKLVDKMKTCPHLLTKFPDLKKCKFVELWAHNRPHASGHQLHFDSDDEGNDGVRNPVISTILYLSDCPNIGGPSLITNQRLDSTQLASKGWLVHSQPKRLVAFDGKVLHGVVPGKGVPPIDETPNRRVSLMMAFWKEIQIRDGDGPGSARPWPKTKSKHTPSWAQQLTSQTVKVSHDYKSCQAVDGIEIDHVYEHLNGRCWEEDNPMPEYDDIFQGF